jgi:hypothetical protein
LKLSNPGDFNAERPGETPVSVFLKKSLDGRDYFLVFFQREIAGQALITRNTSNTPF